MVAVSISFPLIMPSYLPPAPPSPWLERSTTSRLLWSSTVAWLFVYGSSTACLMSQRGSLGCCPLDSWRWTLWPQPWQLLAKRHDYYNQKDGGNYDRQSPHSIRLAVFFSTWMSTHSPQIFKELSLGRLISKCFCDAMGFISNLKRGNSF